MRSRQTVYVEDDEVLWRQEVRDRLRSQTTAIVMVAVIAFAALGVGLWGLFVDTQDSDATRLRLLEQRIARVESTIRQRSDAQQETLALRRRQQSLEQRLQTLEDRADDPNNDLDAMSQAIAGTQQAVEQLEERVDQLEQAAP